MADETWDDLLGEEDSLGDAAEYLSSAEGELEDAAASSDLADWQEATGDYWADSAADSLETAIEAAADGNTEFAAQQFANAEREAGLAEADYSDAASYAADAATSGEWASQDLTAAETELADSGYTDSGYTDSGYTDSGYTDSGYDAGGSDSGYE